MNEMSTKKHTGRIAAVIGCGILAASLMGGPVAMAAEGGATPAASTTASAALSAAASRGLVSASADAAASVSVADLASGLAKTCIDAGVLSGHRSDDVAWLNRMIDFSLTHRSGVDVTNPFAGADASSFVSIDDAALAMRTIGVDVLDLGYGTNHDFDGLAGGTSATIGNARAWTATYQLGLFGQASDGAATLTQAQLAQALLVLDDAGIAKSPTNANIHPRFVSVAPVSHFVQTEQQPQVEQPQVEQGGEQQGQPQGEQPQGQVEQPQGEQGGEQAQPEQPGNAGGVTTPEKPSTPAEKPEKPSTPAEKPEQPSTPSEQQGNEQPEQPEKPSTPSEQQGNEQQGNEQPEKPSTPAEKPEQPEQPSTPAEKPWYADEYQNAAYWPWEGDRTIIKMSDYDSLDAWNAAIDAHEDYLADNLLPGNFTYIHVDD